MNKKQDLLLGIDIGTTGAKCTFYDLHGTPVSSGYQEYRMLHPQENWTEQDPNKWWQAVKENIQLCIDSDDIDTACVVGIAVSSTNAVMLLASCFLAGGYGVMSSVCQSTAILLAGKEKRGLANSTYYIGLDLGMTLGPLIGGALYGGLDIGWFYPVLMVTMPLAGVVYIATGRRLKSLS